MTIATTANVDPSVELGEESIVEDFVLLGIGPRGDLSPLKIGAGARIRSHTVIYAGSSIGRGFQTGHAAMVRESCSIGAEVSIGSHSIVEHHVTLGDRVRIHTGAFIPEFTVVEADAWIGPRVTMTNARYPASARAKDDLQGPMIGAHAKIGANATLLPGVRIGRDALVGAGSVVTSDVPAGTVVAGNPAKVLRSIDEIDAYR